MIVELNYYVSVNKFIEMALLPYINLSSTVTLQCDYSKQASLKKIYQSKTV